MDADQQAAPAGDIGNHVLPKVIVILTGVIALLALIIRLLARHIMRKLGIADILLVISMIFYIVHHYNAYQAAIYPGLGVHQWQYNPTLAAASHYVNRRSSWMYGVAWLTIFQNFKLGSVFFGLNIVFLKIAVLIDWIHTFVPTGTRNGLFWILHTLIWTNAVFYLIGTFIEAFQCPPEDVNTSRCNLDVPKYNVASGVINVISDLTILIAPHWVIWKLNLSTVRKVGVSVLFVIGALATGSAIARVVYVSSAYRTGDILFHVVTINLWAIAEQTFGYLVIGIPAIPKVIRDLPCARHLGSLVRSKSKPTTNPSRGYPNQTTWPNWPSRRYREVWENGDVDTHVLVTIEAGRNKDITVPDVAQLGKEESRTSSADGLGMAVTR
ncbi:hypothetical protein F5B22DRAFT_326973 [Xylaria bambusicola]|uniref:uncharacterized protein n=1 Tax=Xylaria bambusicola TaxID=326684 RepID=UPI0020081FD2|nr:uncharacterized protein F5B22DRAFT_326973 [Xylaria bambusicola]KAI0509369.1 hypothetical protein F5B22DRAFT_326973 [Xylaria bambusicola]